jgi:hypothetical protein
MSGIESSVTLLLLSLSPVVVVVVVVVRIPNSSQLPFSFFSGGGIIINRVITVATRTGRRVGLNSSNNIFEYLFSVTDGCDLSTICDVTERNRESINVSNVVTIFFNIVLAVYVAVVGVVKNGVAIFNTALSNKLAFVTSFSSPLPCCRDVALVPCMLNELDAMH